MAAVLSTMPIPVRLTVGETTLMETVLDVPLKTKAHKDGLTIEVDVEALHDALIDVVDGLGEALATGALL